MTNRDFNLHDLVTLRLIDRSPDSDYLAFLLKRSEVSSIGDRLPNITWYPARNGHEIPADAVPIRDESEDTPTSYVRKTSDNRWECFGEGRKFGEGHNFMTLFQEQLVRQNATLLHATGFRFGDRGVVICGRGGIGKSSISFAAFNDPRVKLLSDDILIATGDGTAYSFPTPHAIYAYHHSLLPVPVRESLRTGKSQSQILAPLYDFPVTRAMGRVAKRWLIRRGGNVGYQATRVRPSYVNVHSDELFTSSQLIPSAPVDTAIYLTRGGTAWDVSDFNLDDARSLFLSATYRELKLEPPLSLYALAESLDLVEHWELAAASASAFLRSCPRVLHVRIPKNWTPEEVQAGMFRLLSESPVHG
jgi:hypothetical protein